MMSGIGSLRPTHAADYDRVCDMIYALNTKATLQERVNLSPSKGTKERGFNFGNQASPRRKAMRVSERMMCVCVVMFCGLVEDKWKE